VNYHFHCEPFTAEVTPRWTIHRRSHFCCEWITADVTLAVNGSSRKWLLNFCLPSLFTMKYYPLVSKKNLESLPRWMVHRRCDFSSEWFTWNRKTSRKHIFEKKYILSVSWDNVKNLSKGKKGVENLVRQSLWPWSVDFYKVCSDSMFKIKKILNFSVTLFEVKKTKQYCTMELYRKQTFGSSAKN